MKVAIQFTVEPMKVEHIPAVSAIERLSFPQPWPPSAYRREILENRMAYYVVARRLGEPPPDDLLPVEAWLATPAGEGLLDRITRLWRTPPEPPSPQLEAELRTIVGYAGLWMMADEGHVTTIASRPDYRGRGVGELLLLALIDRAISLRARWMTLEVRASNTIAQNLYRKYTFKEMGVRKRYYSDNGEDALVMWTDALDSPAFLEALRRNEARLAERLGASIRADDHAWEIGRG